VANTGSIPAVASVTSVATIGGPFSDILGTPANRPIAVGASTTYDAGLSWTELGMSDLGQAETITYTVLCQG
jgi:hypothetical protein